MATGLRSTRRIDSRCSARGSILLAFGVFAPLVSIPMLGHLNYFRNGQGDGVIVLILAGVGVC